MTKQTRVLAVVGAVLGVLLVAVALIPLLFGGRIAQRVKTEVNNSVEARVDWRDAGLSLFGDFPNLTLRLDGLSIAGTRRFAADTLARVRRLAVVLDLRSVLANVRRGAPIVVRSVRLDQPTVTLRVLEDGSANWEITKPTPAQNAPKPIDVTLESLAISGGAISLDDKKSRLTASLVGFRQSLSGDFGKDLFTLVTRAHVDTASVAFAGIPYLRRVALDIAADLNANMKTKTFTFAKNEIRVNDLALAFAGSATMGDPNLILDLSFKTPSTDVRHILSLVPAIYARDFEKLKTSGTLALSGKVKGEYGKRAFPSFALGAKVANGAFQYPDLPLPARDIALDLDVRNAGGNIDSTVVNLSRFHAAIGGQPIDGGLVLRTPVSDPDADLRLTGRLDLADLGRTVKLTNMSELTGKIAADLAVRTRMSSVDRKEYDRVSARGTLDVRGVSVKSSTLPRAIAIDAASLAFSPQRTVLDSLTGRIGSSDVRLAGALDNLLPFVLRGDPLRGTATFSSRHFNLDEWQSDDAMQVIPVPANLDVALQASVGELEYGKLRMTDARGGLRVKDRRATLESFSVNTLGGEIGVTGWYETTNIEKPTFDMNVQMKSVDIPSAFNALVTVQILAPVAKFARGSVSTDLHFAGPLGKNMLPVFSVLDGKGSIRTSTLLLQGLPALGRVADAVKIERFRSPTLDSLRASIRIENGRVEVNPFTVRVGQTLMRVSGSHGIDQSMQFTLGLRVPRSELGSGANQVLANLASRAGRSGLDLQAADTVGLVVRLGGTLTNPTVQTNLGDLVTSAGQSVKQAAAQALTAKAESAKTKVDSAALEARKKAQAEADKLIADAEQKAASLREEASRLAERIRQEGAARADSLVAKASTPLAKVAARAAADRLRKEANDRADQIVREANTRADALVAEAKKKAAAIAP